MSRHWGISRQGALRVARIVEETSVLGPGTRAVVLVQGCHLRCGGCIAAETHPLEGGEDLTVEELCQRLVELERIDGVTFSGGEPFLQAAALVHLLDRLRQFKPGFSAMSYSGYRLEWLRLKGSEAQRDLLSRLDILIDGPYVQSQHAPLRWRGSRNQRLHALSSRHRPEIEKGRDESAGVELSVDEELGLEWVGVPPVPDFAERLAVHTN